MSLSIRDEYYSLKYENPRSRAIMQNPYTHPAKLHE